MSTHSCVWKLELILSHKTDLQSSMRGSLSQFGVMSPLFPSMGSNSGANMRVSLEHFGNQGMGGMQGMGNVMSGVGGATGGKSLLTIEHERTKDRR